MKVSLAKRIFIQVSSFSVRTDFGDQGRDVTDEVHKVNYHPAELGWVDLVFGYSTVSPILCGRVQGHTGGRVPGLG